MSTISVRAKTTIKLDTGKSSVDYIYMAGTPIEQVAHDVVHALIQAMGTSAARDYLNAHIEANYDSSYQGLRGL